MDPLAERLRAARERQGRTLRDLSAETKIREPFLEALENGRYNVLPAVYVKSFIRTAGAALQIPSKEIAALMNVVFDPDDDEGSHLPATPQPPAKPPASKSTPPAWDTRATSKQASAKPASVLSTERFTAIGSAASRIPLAMAKLLEAPRSSLRSPLVLSMAILACIAMFVLVWALFFRSSDDSTMQQAGSADTVLDVNANEALGGGGGGGAASESDSMQLTAVATDTAWLNITSDDKRSQQILLLPGGDYRWSAMQKFVLSISNAGVVTFSRNGQSLKPFGKNGEVVRSVTITRKDVRSSATVVRPAPKTTAPAARPIITPVPQQRVNPNNRTNPERIQRR